nr:hypothetical protein [Rhodoferax sp.]
MADTDLVFAEVGATSDLVFGDTFTPSRVDITVTGVMPALTVAVRIGPPRDMDIIGSFPALTLVAHVEYHTNTERPIAARLRAIWEEANGILTPVAQPFADGLSYAAPVASGWQEATRTSAFNTGAWADGTKVRRSQRAVFQDGVHSYDQVTGLAQDGVRIRAQQRGLFQDGVGIRHSRGALFQDGIKRRNLVAVKFQEGLPYVRGWKTSGGYALPKGVSTVVRFQEGRRPPAGAGGHVVPPVGEPCYTPNPHLVFADLPGFGNLVFICDGHADIPPLPGAPLVILPARFYMTAHTIFAQRLPDLADIPIFDASVSADSGSFCWTLSASGPSSLFSLLAPMDGLPVRLRLTLDGIPWVFAVDALSRTSAFGKTGVSISGRSVTALIGAPYLRATARANTEARLAQQLALDALQYTGVDLNWGLTDWVVPTAAWSHMGTPLDAVQAIAQAAGGYLQSHRSEATLLTRHPYSQRTGDQPGAPWGWMTGSADVELAPDAIITEGLERKDGPDINAVYVSGTAQGVLAQVKRTGSAADKLAAMVTDALITDSVAARQRGLAILGTAGPQYNVRMDLPVLTGAGQPGVLDVGQLVQINASTPWRGRVRAVSVSAKSPTLRQSITLERHL